MNDGHNMAGRTHFSFSLRTVFVLLTAFCLLFGYVGYEYKWIKERRAYLAEKTLSSPGMVKAFPAGFHRVFRSEPLLLWLFDEPALMELGIWIDRKDVVEWPETRPGLITSDNPTLVRARRLFPEASISLFCKVNGTVNIVTVKR